MKLKIAPIELEDGSIIGFKYIKILSIPDISILSVEKDKNDYLIRHKKIFAELLEELYAYFFDRKIPNNNISFEILLNSNAINNQTYNAKVDIYFSIRVIASTIIDLNNILENFKTAIQNTLSFCKYRFIDCTLEEVEEIYKKNIDLEKRVIYKSKRMENLQSIYLPQCFAFDRIFPTNNDFSKIINLLITLPNSMISFQIIPTQLSYQEKDLLEKTTNLLDMINKGVNAHNYGTITNAIAEKHLEIYKYYNQNKNSNLYLFNILVYGENSSIQNITNRIISSIGKNINSTISIQLESLKLTNEIDFKEFFLPLPWVISEVVFERQKNDLSGYDISNEYLKLSNIITADEASEFFILPFGNDYLTAGIDINKSIMIERKYNKEIINKGEITAGILKSTINNNRIGFSLNDLTKHMLIVGTPGSGKTNFSIGLLNQLWKEHSIPFLVIEPVKNEYRSMIDLIPDLQIFTPGKDFISPYVVNPFIPPKNVKLQSFKTVLKTAFGAAITMTSPLDKIFEETINNCYSKFGWLDYYSIEDNGEIFNISDFLKCFSETFSKLGYVGEAKNIGSAGLVRLQGLLRLFDNYYNIPIEDILSKPTVIELAAIENEEEKALLIALLLLNILSYVNSNYLALGELKNVILLEEAHVLLNSNSFKESGEANPNAIATRLFKRMLAEIRSAGIGIIIADQSPESVKTDIIKLTNIKLSFNLVEENDRCIFASSTNMSDIQKDRLPRLISGEAFFYMNGLDEPEEITTTNYRKYLNIRTTISDEEVREKSLYWNNKLSLLKPYPECKYNFDCEACNYIIRNQSKEYARRFFWHNFGADSSKIEELINFYSNFSSRVKIQAKDTNVSSRIIKCTKIHFLRRIMNETKIKINKEMIMNALIN